MLPLIGALLGQLVPCGFTPSFSASAGRVLLADLLGLGVFVVVEALGGVAEAVVVGSLDDVGVAEAVVVGVLDGVVEAAGVDDCVTAGSLGELFVAVGSSDFFPQLARARTLSSTKQVVQQR